MKEIISFLLAMLMLSAAPGLHKKKIKIFLAGDSTMSVKETKAYPETGWGMPFVHLFDSSVFVENRAKNGRSTKTFISEGLWDNLIKDVGEGDYVFIQFGHNDESIQKKERYSTPAQYKANIIRFILETSNKKATPVLLTPVSRRKFVEGKAMQTHEPYSQIVREIAREKNTAFIDLDRKSIEYYELLGEENSKMLFLQLDSAEHPNYPQGKKDNTHFNELGARKIAQMVLAEIKILKLELAERIIKPAVKK